MRSLRHIGLLTFALLGIVASPVAGRSESVADSPRVHWSFQLPRRSPLPTQVPLEWRGNPIDRLIAARQEERTIRPQPEAPRTVWLRRVYLDTIGLPPSREELTAFLTDPSADAATRVVDRLLQRPEFGERWARHCMDLWRYSDWWGLDAQLRYSQKHLWHWRDWIIESLNADKGYDRMILEMLAADELAPEDRDALRATGFLCRSYYLFNRTTWLDEVVEHTSRAFLGLTMQCVKCHDHKYDPLEHADYYRMRAIFEPYHVRLDAWPGETDFEKNGLPRAFDLHVDQPTYLHRRGDDKQPDTNHVIRAGIPALFGELTVTPVTLPAVARAPGLLEFVRKDRLAAAQQQIAEANASLEKARLKLRETESNSVSAVANAPSAPLPGAAPPVPPRKLVTDSFTSWQTNWWEMGDGQWKFENGRLRQARTGPQRTWLRSRSDHPENFYARVQFKILGGEMWKSVGFCFDVQSEREGLVYLSAFQDSKVQVAFGQAGHYTYPGGGAQARPVRLNESYVLEVRLRGRLVNVSVNGEPAVAYELPEARQTGRFQLITYDASAEFSEFSLSELPADQAMIPAAGTVLHPLEEARAQVTVATRALAAAALRPAACQAAWAADVARYRDHVSSNSLAPLLCAAAQAEAELQEALAETELARVETEALKAGAAPKAESEKKRKAAQEALEKARDRARHPGETYVSLSGALKALEGPQDAFDRNPSTYPGVSTGRRLALARWMASPTNPLTARVMVNHLWTRVFGESFVPDLSDFGRRCPPPLHQDVLDTLALELIENEWSLKHVLRLMLTSRLYRSASSAAGADAATVAADPENKTWWRMNPKRLDAQALRDSLLQVAGLLETKLGGPSIAVPGDENSHRRALYFQQHGELEHRFLGMFDNANVFDCYRRRESITPQQALALENSRLTRECAEALEKRLSTRGSQDSKPGSPAAVAEDEDQTFIRDAFLALLARSPRRAEEETCQASLNELRAAQGTKPDPARARALFLQALMSHNDFVTVR